MSIARGTTPDHTFTTSIDLSGADALFITYKQLGRLVLEKTKEECQITSTQVDVGLTQRETLAFNPKYKVEIQIRVRFPDGSALSSQIMTTDVDRLLKEGEI